MKSKELFRKTAYSLIMAVVILFTAVFSTLSYAWLVNYKTSGDFDFTANKLSPYTLEIAKITIDEATSMLSDEEKEAKRAYTTLTNFKIETKEDGTNLDAALSNMSFGTIDNVAQLKNENYVYLRLTVPKELGDTVKLNLHYNSPDFIKVYKNIYAADGLTVTGTEDAINDPVPDNTPTDTSDDVTIEEALKRIETAEPGMANDKFLLYNAVVSNEDCEANAIKQTITFDDINQQKFTAFTDYEADPAGFTIELKNDNFAAVTDGGNWYVYIRIIPNLAVFAYSIEYISHIMPCYMYFNVGATFESAPLNVPATPEVSP